MNLRLIPLAAAGLLLWHPGTASATETASADSITETVAVFIASNLRQGVDAAVEQFGGYGIELDRNVLDSLVIEQLRRPYDADAYKAANQAIYALVNENLARRAEQFLSQASARPGAVTLPSGVVMETLVPGTGATPSEDSRVEIFYTGSMPDGTVFDTVGLESEPMRARVSDLAPGMAEALTHMAVRGKYDVWIPAPLAYGSEGIPGVIPPDTPLKFTIELLSIE